METGLLNNLKINYINKKGKLCLKISDFRQLSFYCIQTFIENELMVLKVFKN